MEQNIIKKNMEKVLSEAFLEYAGYNLQRRAIPDVRDGLKWGARQLIHAQMLGKFTYDKPFKKAIKSVSQAMGYSYVHGDASAYGTFIRMAKPFVMNVPLQEAKGNYGTLIDPDDHSASRYVEMRGSEACSYLLKDLNKDTIVEWEDTYDLEGKFPKVLPSKGFWNLTNGCISIGSGMSCSIPPFNLKELNSELIKLLWDEDIEIVLLPDFPTGATILNKNEVINSLNNGNGKACKIRAEVEFDQVERCFIVKEMPYSTYTNTICKELADMMQEDENSGIKEFVDYTGQSPDLRIYLTKTANPDKVLKKLYKKTSLQTFYSINLILLDKGEKPKLFSLKEAMLAHLDHERQVYIRGYQYDINKLNVRLHIIEGLLIAMASINEVVQTIKSSSTTSEALTNLTKNFNLDEGQAKAILDMKLARLAHLEVSKLEKEKSEKETERNRIQAILDDENLLKKEIEKGLREVMEKFGDARRTKVLNLETSEDEPIEIKQLQISLTNKNNLYVNEASSLYTQRRGGVGAKLKVKEGEYVLSSRPIESNEEILLFSQNGNFYPIAAQDIPRGEIVPIEMLAPLKSDEKIKALTSLNKKQIKSYIIFITKNGFIKKSNIEEYNIKRKTGTKAITLEDDDEIINIVFTDKEKLGLLSTDGNFILVETDDIRPIGRVSKGIKGMKLNDGESVISAHLIPEKTSYLISISGEGLFKRTPFSEFNVQGKNTKGAKIQKLNDDDWMADFLPMTDEKDVLISSTRSSIKLNINDVPVFSKGALGNKSIKLNASDNVVGIS